MRAKYGDVLIAAAFADRIGAGHVGRAQTLAEALSSMDVGVRLAVSGEPGEHLASPIGLEPIPPRRRGPKTPEGGDWISEQVRAIVVDGVSRGAQQLLDRIPASVPRVMIGAASSAAYRSDISILPGFPNPRARTRANRVYRGVDLVPIRDDVRARRERITQDVGIDRDVRHLLSVVLGGTDATGLRDVVSRQLNKLCAPGEDIRVFPKPQISAVNGRMPRGREQVGPADASERLSSIDPRNAFLDAIAGSSFVLSAAGTTAWELAHLGVPFGLVRVVPDQEPTYWGMVARGWAEAWGLGQGLGRDHRLALAIEHARRSPAGNFPTAVDGLGATRIADLILRADA